MTENSENFGKKFVKTELKVCEDGELGKVTASEKDTEDPENSEEVLEDNEVGEKDEG